MIDPNKVTEAVMEFTANPTWKEIFTNAPGGAMERLAISFYFSKFHDQFKPEDFQEYRDLRDEYEKSLTEEDLQYLIDNTDKEPAVKHYQELLNKLQQGGGEAQGQMRFEKEGESEGKPEEGKQQQGEEVVAEKTETKEMPNGEQEQKQVEVASQPAKEQPQKPEEERA